MSDWTEAVAKYGADDAMSLVIGRTAQWHARLDLELRRTDVLLRPFDPRKGKPGLKWATGRILERCEAMLETASPFIEGTVLSASREVLEAARVANERRTEAVHDIWVRLLKDGVEGKQEWHHMQKHPSGPDTALAGTVREWDYVHSIQELVRRTYHRVWAMNWALRETVPSVWPRTNLDWLPDMIAIMHDQFDLSGGGVRPLHRESSSD